MPGRSRKGAQGGQVVVLIAIGMAAMVGIVGLVLVGGMLYWQQRSLQIVADAAALAGSQHISAACNTSQATAVLTAADSVLRVNLGGGSGVTITAGNCSTTAYVGTASYPAGIAATLTYPYQGFDSEVQVALTSTRSQLLFSAYLGASQATVGARAVAEHSLATLPVSFGLVAENGLLCTGSGTKLDVQGSIYAGPNSLGLSQPSISGHGSCSIYAHKTTASNGTTDWGDILAYDDAQPNWLNGNSGSCQVGSATNGAICADGFELAGFSAPQCATSYPPSPPGSMYMDTTEVGANLNPCDGVPPEVPLYGLSQFLPPEPDQDAAAKATLKNPAPGGGCTPTQTLSSMSFTWNGNNYTGFGSGPSTGITVDANNYVHLQPGCYGYLNVEKLLNAATGKNPNVSGAVLDPGFYYFNGCSAACSTGGGICLSQNKSASLFGQDITLEFVNSTSFTDKSSTSTCDQYPSAGCGSSITCAFGSATSTDGYTLFSAPCNSTTVPSVTCPTPAGGGASDWCKTSDASCWDTLIWTSASPPIGGDFFVKGPGQASNIFGNVFWTGPATSEPQDLPGPTNAGCTWTANSGSQLIGELVCDSLLVQGGTSGGALTTGYTNGFSSGQPRQSGLVE
jgi:putative Flp pilus-assembly TadE/G-like protein